MMNTQKRNRTHRQNSGSGNRAPKGRGSFDKNVVNEGIFANPRFTYIATSLVGCPVQLQVKNGKMYEGILKTCSPKMDVVLEMAHKVDDTGNNNVPSRDLVQDKIIFNCSDILVISAVDVDLDYAVKDSFTDSAISKQNGMVEKGELRELTPWEPEEDSHTSGLTEGQTSSNGWDPNEMFSTNEKQFNVISTYDESLHQYTVPLEKKDTKEYREKEERAAQLAHEIEKSDGYKQRIDLENDGDDEEAKFSAVVRPETSNPGKYVPPNKRNPYNQHNQQRNIRHGPSADSRHGPQSNNDMRHGPHPGSGDGRRGQYPGHNSQDMRHGHPDNRHGPSPSSESRHGPPPGSELRHGPMSENRQGPPPGADVRQHQPGNVSSRVPVHQPPPQPTAPRLATQQSKEEAVKINGSDVKEEVKTEDAATSSPEALSAGPDKAEHTSPVSKTERKNHKANNTLIQDLKDFSVNFKLSDESKETKKTPERVEMKPEVKEEERVKSPAVTTAASDAPKSTEATESKDSDVLKTSTLNPNAPSFVFNPGAKPFQPKQHPQQVTTPPRPQTQSPIIQPMPPAAAPMQPIYHHQPVTFLTAPLGQQIQQSQPRPPPKRAVVSIQPPRTDFTAAAAQAATGAPLLAHTPFSSVQNYFMMPQPASYQVGQVMPMPSATPAAGPRMMTPPSGASMDMSQQPTGPTMFTMPMGPNGPMPAHIPHQPYNPQPAHIGPHQQGQQNHPAPSPVQHVVTSQSHPPTSNTPQPHNHYQTMSIQGHPPLQPSPHNPASPQTVHMPAVQYQFPIQMQGGNQVMSQTHPPTSVPHSMHSNMQPHFVMMPHLHNQHNQQTHHQFQPHHIGPGQASMVHQAGVPNPLQNTQPGPQFIPQVPPSQGAPPSIQNFQQNH